MSRWETCGLESVVHAETMAIQRRNLTGI